MQMFSTRNSLKTWRIVQHSFILKHYYSSSFTSRRHVTEICSSNDNNVPCFVAIRLRNKRLLRICGPESFIYLQSLLSNDMRKLLTKNEIESNSDAATDIAITHQPVIYAYLLSAVGKVLCDMFVYRGRFNADGEYILEVDHHIANAIKRLLLGYNVNKSVKVEFANDLHLWSLIPYRTLTERNLDNLPDDHSTLEQIDSDDIKLVADPRIGSGYFGYRFLTRLGGSELEQIGRYVHGQSNHKQIKLIEGQLTDYQRLKYRLGVAEGYRDISSGLYFPFELNGDYLNAIALDKGLFTSEEKIIRIYSKQAIKRRIFPVEFQCTSQALRQSSPAPHTFIQSANGQRKIGELIGRMGRYGIATLFVPMDNNYVRFRPHSNLLWQLRHQESRLRLVACIPSWWPHNYDQIYLDAPAYPECLFKLNSSSKTNEVS